MTLVFTTGAMGKYWCIVGEEVTLPTLPCVRLEGKNKGKQGRSRKFGGGCYTSSMQKKTEVWTRMTAKRRAKWK